VNTTKKLQELLLKIPKNKVTTYKILARELKIHPRAVGRLLSKNDPRKAPCYKVVYSSGKVGGYSSGVKEKIKLLKKDGIEIRNGKVDLKRFLFDFHRK
jgi:O6-methylguanine-DNA--protein-cysteine methyltransferase